LIKLAYSFEVNAKVRHAPTYVPSFGSQDFVPRGPLSGARDSRPKGGAGGRGASAAARSPVAGRI
jgi:hypothetical protein